MLAIILLSFLILFAFWNFIWKRKGFPPGPTPIPLFGNTLDMKSSAYEPFQKWTRKFGPIYTIWIGENPVVMVTEYELMRNLFVKEGEAYAGRHFMAELFEKCTACNGQNGGVIRTEGEPWKVMRRFGLQSMRNLGMGRTGLEQQFLLDINKLIDKLRNMMNGEEEMEVDLQKQIDRLIGSIINRLLFGYAFDDEQICQFYELKQIMNKQVELMSSVTGKMIMNNVWLRHLPIFSRTFKQIDNNLRRVFQFVDRPIQARILMRQNEGHENGDGPKDLLDYFLDQMEMAKHGKGDPEQMKYFTRTNLRTLCFDLFLAGQETTATTLNFLVLYLLLDQRVQEKMHKELDRLEKEKGGIDENGIELSDRPKLPFLNAIINEAQRMCNLLPINLSHRTMCDVNILDGKFQLKKGTIIIPQISCVLYDEKIFPNPLRFEPERFLDENGQLKRCDELIPFGLGKRICMGESLARMELFLFTTNFFRNFQIHPIDPLKPPSPQKKISFATRLEHSYKCRLVLSNKKEEKN